jgi:hypothetical protein
MASSWLFDGESSFSMAIKAFFFWWFIAFAADQFVFLCPDNNLTFLFTYTANRNWPLVAINADRADFWVVLIYDPNSFADSATVLGWFVAFAAIFFSSLLFQNSILLFTDRAESLRRLIAIPLAWSWLFQLSPLLSFIFQLNKVSTLCQSA